MAPTPVQTPNFSRPLPSPYLRKSPGSPPAVAGQQDVDLSESSVRATTVPKSPLPSSMPEKSHQAPRSNTVRQETLSRGGRNPASSLESELQTQKSLNTLRNEVNDMEKPIMEFRPEAWPSLDRNRVTLKLDLFWPIKAEDMDETEEQNTDGDQKGAFPFKELKPILTFRNLHILHLSGMMTSYQPTIWEVCWLNKNLSTLTLEMALEPEFKDDFKTLYKKIDVNWTYDGSRPIYTEPTEYLGLHGYGALHEEFGSGEYLDRTAMKQAQVAVVRELSLHNMRYLPITHLTLSNFVIDAGPFFRWFDPARLKELTFRATCWDAGFYLPNEMRTVVVVSGPPKLKTAPVSLPLPAGARVIKPGELKVVTLSKGKVVKREAWDGKNHLPEVEEKEGAGAGAGGVGGGKGLKKKVSQMMGLGKAAGKEAKK